eukprot:CAMPEP_0204864940 /NCGR_PEP_ID=MMETSP1348-20121228/4452_1 /ASSEMBLY_ACC=CAM_ASM_000700 /TAXON_ID=215587 /ORGANISM="Aplanochytrium stocchinoi, Strain GSBS06" /LENGTH=595 /DNA_ID=CAMNT_0052015767 /DNA_START=105 /DNA_END=1892 /DNA_ORIENTATION=+
MIYRGSEKDRDLLMEICRLRKDQRELYKQMYELEEQLNHEKSENVSLKKAQVSHQQRLAEETRLRQKCERDVTKYKNQFLDVKALLTETLAEAKTQAVDLQKSKMYVSKLENKVDTLEEQIENIHKSHKEKSVQETNTIQKLRMELSSSQLALVKAQSNTVDLESQIRELGQCILTTQHELSEYKQRDCEMNSENDGFYDSEYEGANENEDEDEDEDKIENEDEVEVEVMDLSENLTHDDVLEAIKHNDVSYDSAFRSVDTGAETLSTKDEDKIQSEEPQVMKEETLSLEKRTIDENGPFQEHKSVHFDIADEHNHESGQKCATCEEERLRRERQQELEFVEAPIPDTSYTAAEIAEGATVNIIDNPEASEAETKPSFKFLLGKTHYELLGVPLSIAPEDDWDVIVNEAIVRAQSNGNAEPSERLSEAITVLSNMEYKQEYDSHVRNIDMFKSGFNAMEFRVSTKKGLFGRKSVKEKSRFFIVDENFICLFWSKKPIDRNLINKIAQSTIAVDADNGDASGENEIHIPDGVQFVEWKDVQSITRTGKLKGIPAERGVRSISMKTKEKALHIEMGSRKMCTSVILTLCRVNNFLMF